MIKVACDYNIKEDIGFILESEKINNKGQKFHGLHWKE